MNKIYDVIHFALNEDVTNETDAFFSPRWLIVEVCPKLCRFVFHV